MVRPLRKMDQGKMVVEVSKEDGNYRARVEVKQGW